MAQEITLKGQNYYHINDKTIGETETTIYIDPFLNEFTLMPRIQINFDVNLNYQCVVSLPELNKLGGRYNVQIVISSESQFVKPFVFSPSQNINGKFGANYQLEQNQSMILTGTDENNYNLEGALTQL